MRPPTASTGWDVFSKPDCERNQEETHGRTMPEPIQTYHPALEKTRKLFQLRERLCEIADGKNEGSIPYDEANNLAVEAVVTANGGMPKATSGPMVRLCKLCRNGWIREAADEMKIVYPDLDSLEQWNKHRGHRKKKRKQKG